MSATTARVAGSATATTTAADMLQASSRGATAVSGGRPVARALQADGLDLIFTLCGGHGTARRD